jgi:hypothetical protein
MLKHNKGENVFSKYVDKKLLCFHVNGYYKVIIKICKKPNKIFTFVSNIIYVTPLFVHMINIWQLAFNLQFPPFFYYDQLLFTMYFLIH